MVVPTPGRPEASAIIWNRSDPGAASNTGSDNRARLRGAVQAGVGTAIGGALFYFFELRTLPFVMFGAAGLILISSLVSPNGLFAALENAMGAVSRRLGVAIMWVCLTAIFFGFLMPFGALFRRGERDRLKRRFEMDVDSYWNWEPAEGPTSATTSLENQY